MSKQADQMNKEGGGWITLMDYAIKNGVSLSTLRRYIKAQKLVFKIQDGRYLLWDEGLPLNPRSDESSVLESQLHLLTQDLNQAQEEIAELKTLIALYEEKLPQQTFNN
jgi:hypothetical protein